MNRHHYQDYSLTLAQHPSETEQRLMLRVLAFCLFAEQDLEFCKGISTDDEPALWQQSLVGEQLLWIELGLPEEKRLQKSCRRAQQAVLLTYNDNAFGPWWKKNSGLCQQIDNLRIIHINDDAAQQLAALANRSMQLQVSIQEQDVLVTSGDHVVSFSLNTIQ